MRSLPTIALFVSSLVLGFAACKEDAKPSGETRGTPSVTGAGATGKPAAERGTPAEAKAMLQKAVEHIGTAGRAQALADFNAKKAPFFDRDLYVVCIGADDKITANGGYPQYVGMSCDALKDADGKPLGRAILDAGNNTAGGASVKYRWLNPISGKTEPKTTFARKVGEDVCGVGSYDPQ